MQCRFVLFIFTTSTVEHNMLTFFSFRMTQSGTILYLWYISLLTNVRTPIDYFLLKLRLMIFLIFLANNSNERRVLASSGVAGLECTGPTAGVVLHFLAKLFEFCQKILIFIQHISFRLTNQLKK